MATKEVIFELDLEIDEVIDKSTLTQRSIEEISIKIKDLKKTQRDAIKAQKPYLEALKILEENGKGASKGANDLRKEINKFDVVIDGSTKNIVKHDAKLKTTRKDYRNLMKVIQAYSDKQEKATNIIKQTDGSIDQLGAALSHNKTLYRKLSKEQRENTELGGELLRLIQKQDKAFKELNGTIGNHQPNVGKYSQAWDSAKSSIIGFLTAQTGFNLIEDNTNLVREFELQIAVLGGVSKATDEQLVSLRNNALILGATTEHTATDVAQLQLEYAKLGFTVDQIISSTESTLMGATALGGGLADTAKLIGGTLKSFGLEATKTTEVVDLLGASTQASGLDFAYLQTALPIVGTTARNAGVDLKTLLEPLGVMASNNIDASTSATSLRNIFLDLSDKGITWEQAMNKINLATDKNKTANDLFGKRSATAAVAIATQRKELDKLKKALDNAGGSAKELADKKLNTLDGSIKLLNSAYQGYILNLNDSTGAGNALSSSIRYVADNFTSIVSIAKSVATGLIAYKATVIALDIRQRFLAASTQGASLKMRIFNSVTKANPIGFVIGLLATLVTWFLSSEERVKSITTPIKILWATFKELGSGFFDKLMTSIKNVFENPKKAVIDLSKAIIENLINRVTALGGIFKSLGKIISSGFTDGYKDFANSTLQLATGVENGIDKASSSIDKFSNSWNKNSKEIDLNNEKLKEKQKIEKELLKTQQDSSVFDSLKLQAQKRAQDLKNQEFGVKDQKSRLDIYLEENKLIERTLEDQLLFEEEIKNKRLELLDQETAVKIAKAEGDANKIQGIKANAKLQELSIENSFKSKKQELEEQELNAVIDFEKRKQELKNALALKNAESDQERELLKVDQDFEKKEQELENLELTELQKTELLALLEDERGIVLDEIRTKWEEKNLNDLSNGLKKETELRQRNSKEVESITRSLTKTLTGLLGDTLAAKLASIAVDAAVQAGMVQITSASAQAQNLAQATAAAPPPLNIPFIATALGQNALISANAKRSTGKILASAALQGLSTVVKKKYKTGGLIKGPSHENGGVPFTVNGQSGFEAEGGEYVVRKSVTEKYRPLLEMINADVNVGNVPLPNVSNSNSPRIEINNTIDYDLLAEKLTDSIKGLPAPVVGVEDIIEKTKRKTRITDEANNL